MKTKLLPLMSLLVLAGTVVSMSGCATGVRDSMRLSEKDSHWNPLSQMTAAKKKEASDKEATPVTMAAIWKDSAYEQVGSKTVLGFGGRIFFYDRDNNAVKAEGELIVYGFDDSEKEETVQVGVGADKKFVFRESEFQTHFSDSGLGASYSVWIPWEQIGGYRKSVTLIPVFKTKDGRLLESGQSIVVLPGKTFNPDFADANSDRPYKVLGHSDAVVKHASFQPKSKMKQQGQAGISQASFDDQGAESKIVPSPGLKSSTINVSPSMARRMASAGATERLSAIRAKRESAVAEKNAERARLIEGAKTALNNRQRTVSADDSNKDSAPTPPATRRAFGAPGSF
ncbi:MAG: hypothetical protein AB8B55_18400 [Mariniblastus sp.]